MPQHPQAENEKQGDASAHDEANKVQTAIARR